MQSACPFDGRVRDIQTHRLESESADARGVVPEPAADFYDALDAVPSLESRQQV